MTTPKRTAANRANARRSTGPRTNAGKAVAKTNAVAHGLRSASLLLPGERAKAWSVFRAGIVESLTPVGTLECELADRIASLAWRLRRVAAYESGATAARIDRAVARVRGVEELKVRGRGVGYMAVRPDPTRPARG